MRIMPVVALTLLTASAACGREPVKLPKASDALPSVPVPADGEVISRAGSEDALQIVIRSKQSPGEIAGFYRSVFTRVPWHLVSDQVGPDSSLTMYAENGGPPMWVTIRKGEGGTGSRIEVSGAVAAKTPHPDSTARPSPSTRPSS